jgi:hypothetical protein
LNSKLDSKDDNDYATYFLFASKSKTIAKRAGYYLGYLVLEDIGKNRSLSELAKMGAKEVEPFLKAGIQAASARAEVHP